MARASNQAQRGIPSGVHNECNCGIPCYLYAHLCYQTQPLSQRRMNVCSLHCTLCSVRHGPWRNYKAN